MAKDKILTYARIFVGPYDLSGDARTIGELGSSHEEIDMTSWADTVKHYLAGRKDIGIAGFQSLMNDFALFGGNKGANLFIVGLIHIYKTDTYITPGLHAVESFPTDLAFYINR